MNALVPTDATDDGDEFWNSPLMMTLNLKASQFTGLMQDKGESDDDRRDAKDAAKQHMEGVLSMLRSRS